MAKNIILMDIYQIIVVYAICFGGEYFYYEPDVFYRFGRPLPYVFPGRLYDWDGSPLWVLKEPIYGASRHMTNVFNVFVWL